MVQASNAAKKELSRYARRFELQHYFRALMSRHANAFHRKASHLEKALTEFLGVSDKVTAHDLKFIEQRLGS